MALTFLRAVLHHGPGRMARALGVVLLACLAEGFGLLLLAPLVRLLGVSGKGSAAPGGLASEASLAAVLGVFVAVGVLRALLIRQREIVIGEIQVDFSNALRQRLYAAIAQAEWLWVTQARRSDLLQALTGDVSRVGQATRLIVETIGSAVLCAVYVLVALVLAPSVTLIALGLGAILVPLGVPQLRRSAAHGERLTASNRQQFATAGEFLDGIKIAKSYGRTDAHVGAFAAALDAECAAYRDYDRARATSASAHQLVTMLALGAGGWMGSQVFDLHPARLLPLILVFSRLFPLLAALSQHTHKLAHLLPAYSSLAEITRQCESAAELTTPAPTTSAGGRAGTSIQLRDVTIRYSSDGPAALSDVDLIVRPCATTAIVGPSGAGKSTLADVILGLLAPTAGEAYVGGERLTPGPVTAAWRSRVAYVQQDTFLFHDTIAANLRWAVPAATEAEMWSVLRQSAAETLVQRLPEGLATQVGDRGVRLSGGERQRLALARALLRKPEVLVLDEATSSLDNENERAILTALDDLHTKLTIVVIAHRLSTVRAADVIVVLEEGRVIESGTWNALVGRPGSRLNALKIGVPDRQPARPAAGVEMRIGS